MLDDAGCNTNMISLKNQHKCGFEGPWTYFVACKSTKCRKNWYRNAAQVDEAIHRRLIRTKSKKPALAYFDGATMSSFQQPRKVVETQYCRQSFLPEECKFSSGYDKNIPLFSESQFDVQVNEKGEVQSVNAKVNIPKMSYIKTGEIMHIPLKSREIIELEHEDTSPLKNFITSFGVNLSEVVRFKEFLN